MKEQNYHPELKYNKKGLWDFLKRDIPLFTKIAASVVFEKQRTFSEDVESISKLFEKPAILGLENIPSQRHDPLIIACNHPDMQDEVLGITFLTLAFNQKRREVNLPGNIHWFMASNAPKREATGKMDMIRLHALDWIQPKFIKTYQFIGTPVGHKENRKFARANSLKTARKYLIEEGGSKVVGIFPEGDVELEGEILKFKKGIEVLARITKGSNLQVLPVGIARNDINKLIINFGNPIDAENALENDLTGQLEAAIAGLIKHKRLAV